MSNKVRGIIITFSDITGEKLLREEREHFTKKLLEAQEEERKRISRELHDDTAQYLSLLILEIEAMIEKEKQLPPAIIQRLDKLRDTAGKALQEVRRFSHELANRIGAFGLALPERIIMI
jgi:signal transduction histidine kinase